MTTTKAAEAGPQRQQGEVTQREGVIARLTDQVDKMRGDSVSLRIKLDELRGQRTALRKEVQELRATLEDRDSRLEDMRVMLENCNDEVAVEYLHQLLRADAFDDSVIINLIDSETVDLLNYYFQPTETAREHPIAHNWTVDCDVATIIQALEELYPLQQDHRHLDWFQMAAGSR